MSFLQVSQVGSLVAVRQGTLITQQRPPCSTVPRDPYTMKTKPHQRICLSIQNILSGHLSFFRQSKKKNLATVQNPPRAVMVDFTPQKCSKFFPATTCITFSVSLGPLQKKR